MSPGGFAIAIARMAGEAIVAYDDAAVWATASGGRDVHGQMAIDRFAMAFGSVAGDLAPARGSNAVVIAGQIAGRILAWLQSPLFNERFHAKGRFAWRMADIPLRLAVHTDPGLLGAATAYQEHWRN
jgi:glucokinase